MKILKQELRRLLSQPLFQENLKTRYPTQSGRPPQPMVAPRNVESALSCLSRQKRRRKKKPKDRQAPPQPSAQANGPISVLTAE